MAHHQTPLKKLLLITYYWPPAGGGGVFRWLKMSKYLKEFGWDLVVFTPEKTDATATDTSLVLSVRKDIEVIRTPIWEPYDLYSMFFRSKGKSHPGGVTEGKKSSFSKKAGMFLRGNFFIPDARKFWIKPSINYLENYLQDNKIDAIVSTGPPHSMHLIAMPLQKKFNIPWIADFRDPWTKFGFYKKLELTSFADKKHKKLEKKILETADKVITVSWSWANDFKSITSKTNLSVITNGYDHEDFVENQNMELDNSFSITHIGSMNTDRNPKTLWKVLQQICEENDSFKNDLSIKLYGPVDFEIINLINESKLDNNLELHNYMPHAEVVKVMQKSQLLLLPINNTGNLEGILPGKLYEYIGAKRPIIAIGPKNTDAYKVISETQAGKMFEYADFDHLKAQILEYYYDYKKNNLNVSASNFEVFQRKNLAKQYTETLNKLVKNK